MAWQDFHWRYGVFLFEKYGCIPAVYEGAAQYPAANAVFDGGDCLHFVALLLLVVFALWLGWLPVTGNHGFVSILLPTFTLAIAMSAKYTRQVRATVLEELNKDYVMGCLARGVK